MKQLQHSDKRNFLIGSILTGLLVAVFAIAPQIDLWMNCEEKCNGIYALTDLDEPFYAAYLQSLMDGKPRRNSPFTGAIDSAETPQRESGLFIQFLASYPPVYLGKIFGLSLSNLMILTTLLIGFFAGFVVYWLLYQFTEDNISSFVGTLFVLFIGTMVGGQGATFSLISPNGIYFLGNLAFMRRIVPAIGFPAFFLFFTFVWRLIDTEKKSVKLISAALALGTFTFCVYSYYYYWTTIFAWFFGLICLIGIFRFDILKENKHFFSGLTGAFLLVLIPFFYMVSNRELATDSVLLVNSTRMPDLFSLPEIVAYFSTFLVYLLVKFGWVDLKDFRIIFLLSLNLVVVVVFNQQIITGHSVQPYHYKLFCANYLAVFSFFSLIFLALKQKITVDRLKLLMLVLSAIPICVGVVDTLYGAAINRPTNLWRDKLVPVTEKIKQISQTPEFRTEHPNSVILSFDFIDTTYFNGLEIPGLTSQPILWGPHLNLLPDIGKKENISRLNTFLYYQKINKEQVKMNFFDRQGWAAVGYLGPDKATDIYSGKVTKELKSEIDAVVNDYEKFCQNFSFSEAQQPKISIVLVNKTIKNDFSNLDLWYERDAGEVVGDYIIYQVKLRQK